MRLTLSFLPWLAHLYTALGLICGFQALLAVTADQYRTAFFWLFAAILVDASDGWLARTLRVQERLPSFNGSRLDDIVDYVTYVFVPAYLLYRAESTPAVVALPVTAAILLSSAYGFANHQAKTADHFFTGFPSYWNIVALYVFVTQLPAAINALILLALCGLVFVRTVYVYPSRMARFRTVTIAVGLIWGGMMFWMIWLLPTRSPRLLLASFVFPAYYFASSFAFSWQRRGLKV